MSSWLRGRFEVKSVLLLLFMKLNKLESKDDGLGILNMPEKSPSSKQPERREWILRGVKLFPPVRYAALMEIIQFLAQELYCHESMTKKIKRIMR